LLSVYEWVKANTSAKEIILCGFSFGGAIAYMGIEKMDIVSSLITIAPAVDRFDLSGYSTPTKPWLVVQGTDDDTVNPQSVFDFIVSQDDTNLTLVKMDEVGHFFHGKLTDLKEVVENFVK
jgi:alpha/beta superfamily hydrolase